MRLLCPFCQKAISVPDSEAGKAVNCPECGQQFAAPQLYTPAPAPLPAEPTPPAPVPETYVHEGPAEPTPPELPSVPKADRELSGFAHLASFPLEPRVIRWIPAVALFLALVLTIFPWDGLYPGGYPAFTQTAWGAAIGGMSKDEVAYDELHTPDNSAKLGDELDRRLKMNWWMIPYLLLIFPTVALAVAGPVVDLAKIKLPPALESAWQFRPALLAALAALTLLFLLAQWASGFGLQRAVNEMVEADFADRRAAANTPEKVQRVEMRAGMEKGKYHVQTTAWLRLAVLMHILAVGAVLAEAGLVLRGNKPPPRVGAMW